MGEKTKGMNSYTHVQGLPSLCSQDENKILNGNDKITARVDDQPSQTLANPRKKKVKGLKNKGKSRQKRQAKTAAEKRTNEPVVGGARGARRFVDMIEAMYRRGQLNARQHQVANTYRAAAEAAAGGIPCALDMSRVRGGGGPASPTETRLWGASVLRQAHHALGARAGLIVTLSVVDGMTFREIAARLFRRGKGGQPRRGDTEYVGRTLRDALTTLADMWCPPARQGRIRSVRDPDAVQIAYPREGGIEPGVVAHASFGRVRFTDPAKREKGD